MVALRASIEVDVRPSPGLAFRGKVLYGVGEIAASVKAVLFGIYLLFFYTMVMGVPGTLVGIAAGIGLVWDAAIDPIIGHISDRARFRMGRLVFMLAGAGTMGLGFWALFSPPPGSTGGFLFGWLLVTSLLVRTSNSLFVIPYYALGAELSRDYHERTTIAGIRAACGLLGTAAVASLSFLLFFPSTLSGVDPKLNYTGYPAMGLVAGLLMSLAALVPVLATLQGTLPVGPRRATAVADRRTGIAASLGTVLRNDAFAPLFLSFSLVLLGTVSTSVLTLHFVTYYVRITDSAALGALQGSFYAGTLLGVPLWLRMSRRMEKRWLCIAASLAMASLMVAAFLLVGEGHVFGTGDVRPILVGEVVAGAVASVYWILPYSMVADVADADELVTGQRREGIFFGMLSLGQQLATALAALLTGVLLDSFAGLAPGQAEQGPAAIERIGLLFSLLPAAVLLAASLAMMRYPLDSGRVNAIQRELERRRLADVI